MVYGVPFSSWKQDKRLSKGVVTKYLHTIQILRIDFGSFFGNIKTSDSRSYYLRFGNLTTILVPTLLCLTVHDSSWITESIPRVNKSMYRLTFGTLLRLCLTMSIVIDLNWRYPYEVYYLYIKYSRWVVPFLTLSEISFK